MKRQLKALFEGHVQGVGFRYMAQSIASQFNITGYVRNLSDGCVEVLAEGDENELKAFLKAIRDSHLSSKIRETREFWDLPEGSYQAFEIAI